MSDHYEGIDEMIGNLEAFEAELETIVLNGKNEKANRYLRGAIGGINRALAELSDALFEVTTDLEEFED